MIQLFHYNGVAVIQYGLQNLSVRVILAIEVAAILLGIMIGVFVQTKGKCYIWLLVPGIIGCLLFVFVNTLGRTLFSNADIWPPLLAEDLIVFSAISFITFCLKKRCKQKSK
jgi:hypothetical protein